jgi:hypothetical protein
MSDPFLLIGRLVMVLLPPFMILLPLALVLLVPNRAAEESARLAVRARLVALLVATVVCLAVWGGLLLTSVQWPWARWAATFSWPLFFPLWFGLAWPLIRARNPAWEGAMYGPTQASAPVRTASLVNRERTNPVTRGMWVAGTLMCLVGPVAIALRAVHLFPIESVDGAASLFESPEHVRWFVFLVVTAMTSLGLLWLPRVLGSMLLEAEPLDAAGSKELSDLYAAQRRRRVLGMFRLNVISPAAIGIIFALAVWFPGFGAMWGLVGGLAGIVLGGMGAIFGFMMTAERAKIAEVRARLEQSPQP